MLKKFSARTCSSNRNASRTQHEQQFTHEHPDTDQLLLYANAQNFVAHWNNLVIPAKIGNEQLQMMRESGIFANDIRLVGE